MATTRQRRIRAHREQLLARHTEQARQTQARIEQISRFDTALAKLVGWSAIALLLLITVLLVLA